VRAPFYTPTILSSETSTNMTSAVHSPHNDLNVHVDHYIGIDVGTGSARACIIDSSGDIKACQYLFSLYI
jgi:hypothetical protein